MFEATFVLRFEIRGQVRDASGETVEAMVRGTRTVVVSGTCVPAAPACSIDDGSECEDNDDCSAGEACTSECACECSIAAGAGCTSDADCEGGTCDLSLCECSQPEEMCAPENTRFGAYYRLNQLLQAQVVAFCAALRVVTIYEIISSALGVPSRPVAGDHTTLIALAVYAYNLLQAQVDMLYNHSDFECGEGENGLTLCSAMNGGEVPAGDFHVLAAVVDGEIPIADPTNHYQYAFVFDADGDTENNYQPSPEYPNDFFKDTDRWYQATYTPEAGWSLVVNDATDGVVTQIASDARIIIHENVIALAVPAAELELAEPDYRVTAFRHTGDYGIPAPHDYDGSLWPAVADGLASYP